MPGSGRVSDIRVRFAPSPTGYLHVGGARTAIFNWLFARREGGRFLIRIEDTDPVRSRSELSQTILDSLKWLGIESDEPVVYQSDHRERFLEAARLLIERGAAYRDYTTPEELEAMKEESRRRGERAFCFRADPETVRAAEAKRGQSDKPYAVRVFAPRGSVSWKDGVHGDITVEGQELDDFVIVRRDGSPTYHLSVVCDDHDMGITRVIRGDDHVSNTPKQISLYHALQWPVPEFAHVPLILGPDKKRLSKRTGAVAAEEYRKRGYLPEALFNYLSLLGWSPGEGDRELFTRGELEAVFSLEGVQAKSAVFDEAKLAWMNGEYLRNMGDEAALTYLLEHADKRFADREFLTRLWPMLKPRIRLPEDLARDFSYFAADPEEYDPKGMRKYYHKPGIPELLKKYRDEIEHLEPFAEAPLEECLRRLCSERNLSAGKLIHPMRLALTGKTESPGLFEVMTALGRQAVLRRIDRILTAGSPR